MSFVLDPPLLVASGAAIERVADGDDAARALSVATAAGFVAVSLALYANVPGLGLLWRPFGARSGREFMLTSGIARIDERGIDGRRHAAALSLFVLYPLWVELGRRLARRSRR